MAGVSAVANAKVQDLLQRQIGEGTQIGAQVCVYRGGERFIDTWAGTMGPGDEREVGADSLFCSFSVTKGVASTALHIQADRGLIDYDAPVTKYWPAFGKHGKERLTVGEAMSHQAGIHQTAAQDWDWDQGMPEHLTNWEAGLRWVEEAEPAWEPATATGYHAVTFAWIAGGIVQHATGRHIQEVIAEDIAKPLGIGDEMYVGIPGGIEERLTTLAITAAGEGMGLPAESDFHRAMPLGLWQYTNSLAFRQACLPSANGHFTARALAKMYAALANGGEVDGVRLVSKERVGAMQRLMTDGVDRVLGTPMAKGIGFFFGGVRDGIHGPMGPRQTAFGHPGAGGAIAFADPEAGLSVALTTNKMMFTLPGEGPTEEICELVRELARSDA